MQSPSPSYIIGSKTKGYFLTGKLFDIEPHRFLLYLAVDKNPNLPELEGIGVSPDIQVDFNLPYSKGVVTPF